MRFPPTRDDDVAELLNVLLALATVLAPLALAWWLLRDRKPRVRDVWPRRPRR